MRKASPPPVEHIGPADARKIALELYQELRTTVDCDDCLGAVLSIMVARFLAKAKTQTEFDAEKTKALLSLQALRFEQVKIFL
jgi:hypothetical protein